MSLPCKLHNYNSKHENSLAETEVKIFRIWTIWYFSNNGSKIHQPQFSYVGLED